MACETCEAKETTGPYDQGVHPRLCRDCMVEVCEKCAGLYEDDAEAVGDPLEYRWCGTVLCKECLDERKKPA